MLSQVFIYLFNIGKSHLNIRLTYQAMNYFHSIAGQPKPFNSELFLNLLEGIKRTARYTVQKKSPITVKHLYKLYSHFAGKLICVQS